MKKSHNKELLPLLYKIVYFFKSVEFNKYNHYYTVDNKKVLKSVTQLVSDFSEPFNSDKVSNIIAERDGITQKEVIEKWESIRINSCKLGEKVHSFCEDYPFNNEKETNDGYEKAVVKFINSLPSSVVPFITELKMYHKKSSVAGTCDLVLYNKDTSKFILVDYKTNKNLFKNYNNKKMLGIFNDLLDTPYNKSQIQLSLYQLLFEQTGLEVSSRKTIWLKSSGEYNLFDINNYTERLKQYLNLYDSKRVNTKNTITI